MGDGGIRTDEVQAALDTLATSDPALIRRTLAEYDARDQIAVALAAGTSGGGVQTATVTLTDAEIKTLPTTPVEIVPAQGTDTMISFLKGIVVIDNTAGAYTNVHTESATRGTGLFNLGEPPIAFQESARVDAAWALVDGSEIVVAEAPMESHPLPSGDLSGNSDYTSSVENQPLVFKWQNGALGDFTGGNAANTLTVTLVYHVLTI